MKLFLLSILATSSLFPTIKFIQRGILIKKSEENGEQVPPISEKLVARLTKVINGEILAIASIPLAATLMARGVGYWEGLPWQAGAAPVVLSLMGLGYKYTKEALTWEE